MQPKKKLGFGMMRLPQVEENGEKTIDVPQVCEMVDTFLARGYTYFDTAYMYHGGESECIVRKAVVERHDRASFTLADKMPMMSLKEADAEKQDSIFHEQLTKCGVTYFDFYLLHALDAETYKTAERLDTFHYLSQQKAAGKIRHLGFSFHDKAEVLDRILTDHPETEFVQIQLNYLDWEDARIQSRKCYETIVRHGKKAVVMEPVRGGKLAKLPEDIAAPLVQAHPDWSQASWAIRFAAELEDVMVVLSGMSDREQLLDNTTYMQAPAPLTEGEKALLATAAEAISALPAIRCTACRYCVDGCPQAIPIPTYFALYNGDQMKLRQGGAPDRAGYAAIKGGRASACVQCRQCEEKCPQHLHVTSWLTRIQEMYETA